MCACPHVCVQPPSLTLLHVIACDAPCLQLAAYLPVTCMCSTNYCNIETDNVQFCGLLIISSLLARQPRWRRRTASTARLSTCARSCPGTALLWVCMSPPSCVVLQVPDTSISCTMSAPQCACCFGTAAYDMLTHICRHQARASLHQNFTTELVPLTAVSFRCISQHVITSIITCKCFRITQRPRSTRPGGCW